MSETEIGSVKNGVSGSECKSGAAVRNVQTQHGDYRTVDEENIVILPLARCHSPEPPVNESGEIESVVWIEPFSEENQVRLHFNQLQMVHFDVYFGIFWFIPATNNDSGSVHSGF